MSHSNGNRLHLLSGLWLLAKDIVVIAVGALGLLWFAYIAVWVAASLLGFHLPPPFPADAVDWSIG
jgi:hypothetical protein